MARDIVDIALVEINSTSQGSKELDTVVEMSVGVTDSVSAVKTMRRKRRPLGYQTGVPDFSVDLTVVLLRGTPEVDWRALQRSKEKFALTYEESEGGKRFTLVDCIVTEVSKPFAESGEMRASVKLLALDELPE
jgi:hypothetical protein